MNFKRPVPAEAVVWVCLQGGGCGISASLACVRRRAIVFFERVKARGRRKQILGEYIVPAASAATAVDSAKGHAFLADVWRS